jgi:hypothetical protein
MLVSLSLRLLPLNEAGGPQGSMTAYHHNPTAVRLFRD